MKTLTMRKLARDVRLTPMAVYHHFQDKDALVDAMVAEGFARLEGYLLPARHPGLKPIARIRLILNRYLDFAAGEPAVFALMFSRPADDDAPFPEYFGEGRSPTFDLLRASVVEAIRAKALRSSDPTELALAFWAQVHGLVLLLAAPHRADERTFRPIVERTLDRLLAGVASSSSSRRHG